MHDKLNKMRLKIILYIISARLKQGLLKVVGRKEVAGEKKKLEIQEKEKTETLTILTYSESPRRRKMMVYLVPKALRITLDN